MPPDISISTEKPPHPPPVIVRTNIEVGIQFQSQPRSRLIRHLQKGRDSRIYLLYFNPNREPASPATRLSSIRKIGNGTFNLNRQTSSSPPCPSFTNHRRCSNL